MAVMRRGLRGGAVAPGAAVAVPVPGHAPRSAVACEDLGCIRPAAGASDEPDGRREVRAPASRAGEPEPLPREPRAGIGTARRPTPRGHFIVRNRPDGYDSPMHGPIASGTSARSPTPTDRRAGGFAGIHGTGRRELLPGRVSHGCIRRRNADMRRLARLLPTGTAVTIR